MWDTDRRQEQQQTVTKLSKQTKTTVRAKLIIITKTQWKIENKKETTAAATALWLQ